MSTRYMKKVFGTDDISSKNLEESESETSDVRIFRGKQKSFNVFSVLNSNSEEESEQETNEIDKRETDDAEVQLEIETKSKKKKKKNRKSNNHKQESREKCKESDDKDDEEIEKTVREINKLLGEPKPCASKDVNNMQWVDQKSKEDTLIVTHKHLNPYNELKRIFGSRTVQADQRPRNRGRTTCLRKVWLVSPTGQLPVKIGLSMAVDKTMPLTSDCQYFVYEHSQSYRHVQQQFIYAVESLNPDNIINLVNTHLDHVESMLQAAELCKLNEDLASAAKLISRALYILEYAFHPLFNMTTGKCRLDYRKQVNRPLFITLFKHLVLVGGRACYRTSLELCKFLLSLSPDNDPLAVVLMMDFYVIRSKEYSWFCEFCSLWEESRNLSQLPNIAYSLALANFHLGNQEKADELLQAALMMFPGVLIPLLDKCSIQTDSRVMSHEFFRINASKTTPPALEKLQSLYIVRSYHLWKEPELLPWLERQVNVVLDKVDAKDQYVKFCEIKRRQRYQGKLPRNILRHIIITDLKEVTVDPHEIEHEGAVLSLDPLPPPNSINLYSSPRAARRESRNSNLFSLFFSSLFMDPDGEPAAPVLNGLNIPHPEPFD